MIQRLWPILILLCLVACGAPLSNSRDQRGGASAANQPTPIPTTPALARPTYTVTRGTVIYQVTFPARVTPTVENELAFAIDGVVKTVYVARNDPVQAGDLIAELDSQPLMDELRHAQTELAIAQARRATAQSEAAAAHRLAEIAVERAALDLAFAREQAGDNPTTAQAYEIARLELDLEAAQIALDQIDPTVNPALQADVDEAALRVADLEAAIASAQLVAPFDGQILSLNLSPGQAITAGTIVGVIADPSQLEVSAGLPANRLGDLAENMPVFITPNGRPGDSIPGTIRQLPFDNAGTVRLSFDDPARANLSLGERVTVSAVIAQHDDVLWLPPAAIRDFNGRKFVVIEEDGDETGFVQRRADVTLGLVSDERIEIISGVAEGDVIVGQ